jgi:hypothetical protein
VGATLAITFLVAALAKRIWPERAPFAVAAVALNPVVLFDTVATAHNDVLVGLASPARWFVAVRKELAATTLLTLGALIKASAAIPLFLFVATVVARRGSGDRPESARLPRGGSRRTHPVDGCPVPSDDQPDPRHRRARDPHIDPGRLHCPSESRGLGGLSCRAMQLRLLGGAWGSYCVPPVARGRSVHDRPGPDPSPYGAVT